MRAVEAWLQGRLTEALPVPYPQRVFTLPHCSKRHAWPKSSFLQKA
ncbi:MAG: hypothetical protein NTY26_02945 [Burkholderiales bacterium]|nr:hypothetical protein [Burkholderiales bacterium]